MYAAHATTGKPLAQSCGFTKPPVDLERVAKQLGLSIANADLGADVSGLLISEGNASIIAVEASDAPNRKRFTIADEIAHFYLRHQSSQANMCMLTAVV